MPPTREARTAQHLSGFPQKPAEESSESAKEQNVKTSEALFEAMCALEEKQARVRKGIDTCRQNHALGAEPGEGYRRALEAYRALGEAHAEVDRLRVEAEAKGL